MFFFNINYTFHCLLNNGLILRIVFIVLIITVVYIYYESNCVVIISFF